MANSSDKAVEASIYSAIGKRIKELRNKRGMTLQGLAEKAGISVAFLSYMEAGKRKGSLVTYYRLAQALDAKFDLFGEPLPGKKSYPRNSEDIPLLSVAEAQAVSHLVKTLRRKK